MTWRTCELLTPQQATGFGLDLPPEQSDGLFGTVYCAWTNTTRDRQVIRRVSISVFTDNPTLEVAYNQDRGRPSFQLTEIAGYPTLVSRPLADEPICDIDVKPAERQSVGMTYESKEFKSNPQQACEVGKQVAAAVLMNLPLKSCGDAAMGTSFSYDDADHQVIFDSVNGGARSGPLQEASRAWQRLGEEIGAAGRSQPASSVIPPSGPPRGWTGFRG